MLNYITWNPNPVIIDLGFFELRWYSLLFLAAFVFSYQLLKRSFKKRFGETLLLDKLAIYVFAGTLAGARLGHCLFYDFSYYRHHLAEIFLPVAFYPHFKITGYQGLASHGAAIGILLAVWLFSRKYHVRYLWILDQLAMVVPLAGACIRTGNLMNSEIIGKATSVPWAFIFVKDDLIPRHPAQVYEAISYLLIFLAIRFISRSRQFSNGYLLGWFLLSTFSARFLIEFVKGDQADFEKGLLLNMGQLLSIPLIVAGITLIIVKHRGYSGRKGQSG